MWDLLFVFGSPLLAALIGWAVLRLATHALSIPAHFERVRRRESRYTVFLLYCLCHWEWGLPIALIGYLIVIINSRLQNKSIIMPATQDLRLIPQASLLELVAMVFGIALYPLVMGILMGIDDRTLKLEHLITSGLIFPGCYVCAYYRLDSNRIPIGLARTAFLLLFPYVVGASALFVSAPLVLLWVYYKTNSEVVAAHLEQMAILMPIAGVMLLGGALASIRARRAAMAAQEKSTLMT